MYEQAFNLPCFILSDCAVSQQQRVPLSNFMKYINEPVFHRQAEIMNVHLLILTHLPLLLHLLL